ncbi:hypothetical protein [Actinomadura violacea]|uniref:Uncharacterized protein n=1 Tax=Actinomadura violacea TaxID=2819934 RepID=A0ABS3RYN2_9ACTN|nr:hypothetical protein [Actinomadura violacea]MBO2461568.1 hypothetical protein [Actinomadura violacea]
MNRANEPLPEFDYTPELHDALRMFLGVWRDGYLAHDIGTSLACTEAESLAELLTAAGLEDEAKNLIDWHADGDDAGDMHYRGGEDSPEDADAPEPAPRGDQS